MGMVWTGVGFGKGVDEGWMSLGISVTLVWSISFSMKFDFGQDVLKLDEQTDPSGEQNDPIDGQTDPIDGQTDPSGQQTDLTDRLTQ